MRTMPVRAIAFCTSIILLSACSVDESPTAPATPIGSTPRFFISDGAHGDRLDGFYFLPPMVPQPKFSGTFDYDIVGLDPVVQVFGPYGIVATFTRGSTPAIVLDGKVPQYSVTWSTKGLSLGTYTIGVTAGATGYRRRVGQADVKLTSTQTEAKAATSEQQIGWKAGTPLAISFRIETGKIVGLVTVSPASARITAGSTLQLTATVWDLHGLPLVGRTVYWSVVPTASLASFTPSSGTTDGSGQTTTIATARTTPGLGTVLATTRTLAGSTDKLGSSPLTVVSAIQPALSAGWFHTCALRNDGTVVCWGANDYAGAGGPFLGQATPPSPPTGMTFIEVSAGGYHTCALVSDGTVGCWGNNAEGEAPSKQAPPAGTTFTQVSAGANHTCALVSDGTISCWGYDGYGQLTPPALPSGAAFRQVSAGGYHTCALVSDGRVVCWGRDDISQVASTPTGTTFSQVDGGAYHSCALASDAAIVCWGANNTSQSTPPEGTFSQVSAGGFHTCAVKLDGTVACWGNDLGSDVGAPPPGAVQVSAGYYHSCALKNDGTVACWGDNTYGQGMVPPGFNVNAQ